MTTINYLTDAMKSAALLKKKGLSLIEVLVALAVFSAAMVAATGVIISVNQAWSKQRNSVEMIQNGRWAMEFMTNEVRHAFAADGGWWGSQHPRDSDGGRTLNFGFDTNFNGLVDTQLSYQHLQDANGTIQRCIRSWSWSWPFGWTSWSCAVLVRGVVSSNPSSKIFDADNDGLVEFELTLRPNPAAADGPGNRSFAIRSAVRTRNE